MRLSACLRHFVIFFPLFNSAVVFAADAPVSPELDGGASEVGLPAMPAPDFQFTTIDGVSMSRSSFPGKVLVLEWFNANCPFVQRVYRKTTYLPDLQREYGTKSVTWVIVNSTAGDHRDYLSPERAREKMAEWKVGTKHYVDDHSGTLGKLFEMKTTPSFAVIGAHGELLYKGAVDNLPEVDDESEFGLKRYLEPALAEIISGKPVSIPASEPYGCSIKFGA